ncbi:hypothetical protein DUNSADRAFT_16832 [Dunaliella salina]|uniref:Uncharacterized protein n=1 Tax=Dunaliella salina TaxID=3046 RepID=A0ABQ7G2U0_DUNSA|nr:hypothetical protein DUNSADRAFT_16832 [Dunaliella salina]|eukprot:KAF5828920.1 hypothetical protein DUNSADRAFT_16832 [Dunaliella salina]
MVLPSRALFEAAGSQIKYRWHDITNPAYNSFFHNVLPKIQLAVTTGGSGYAAYCLIAKESER